jgi:hypothetical protein
MRIGREIKRHLLAKKLRQFLGILVMQAGLKAQKAVMQWVSHLL